MRRSLLILTAALSLLVAGVTVAQAGEGNVGPPPNLPWAQSIVTGTITSIDHSKGSFQAAARLVAWPERRTAGTAGSPPATTPVTITTGSDTDFHVLGIAGPATFGDLQVGQTFFAAYDFPPSKGLTAITAGTPESVFAYMQPILGVCVAGTISSVDTQTSSFVASAYQLPLWACNADRSWQGGQDPAHGEASGSNEQRTKASHRMSTAFRARAASATPAPSPVTITVTSKTKFWVNGDDSATLGDLATGQSFIAWFAGMPDEPLAMLTANPALKVAAWGAPPVTPAAPVSYAFVGTVAGVSTTLGTVTVNVTHSDPTTLVPSGAGPQTFAVGSSTVVLSSSSLGITRSSLGNVKVGDTVAGGVVGPGGLTLTQVEALQLQVLLDLPPGTGSSTKTQALDRVLKRLKRGSGHRTRRRQHSRRRRRGR